MDHLDHSLNRLLKSAAQAPQPAPEPMPFALEIRTLAGWRSTGRGDETALLALLFRRAVIFASLVTALSLGWSWLGNKGDAVGVTALTNYEAKLQWLP